MRRGIAAGLLFVLVGCGSTAQTSGPSAASRTSPPPVTAVPTTSIEPSATAAPSSTPPLTEPPVATAWHKLGVAGPDAREDHTWTLDPSSRIAYLFGGRDGDTVRGDLWAFDLATNKWRELVPDGDRPDGRFGHEAVWVDGVGVVLWAGQAGPTAFFDDLWAYDPAANAWSRLPNDGARPKARYGSCSAVGEDGRLWISHGFTEDGVRFSDTRVYDFEAGAWTDETPDGDQPVVRCLHACWLTADGDLALYAGQTTGVRALGDLWRLSDGSWSRLDEDLPPERNLPAVARHGDDAVVFGGLGLDGDYLRDVYRVDGTTLAFEQLRPEGSRPTARAGAALIDDPGAGRLLVFGGKGSGNPFADTWELTLD
jgi:Galactose oxidase, central domain